MGGPCLRGCLDVRVVYGGRLKIVSALQAWVRTPLQAWSILCYAMSTVPGLVPTSGEKVPGLVSTSSEKK